MSRFAMLTMLILTAVVALGLQACGEKEQVIVYKQGNYQGKSDGKPWENATFAGDQAKWENSIRARGQNQNEYKRIAD